MAKLGEPLDRLHLDILFLGSLGPSAVESSPSKKKAPRALTKSLQSGRDGDDIRNWVGSYSVYGRGMQVYTTSPIYLSSTYISA